MSRTGSRTALICTLLLSLPSAGSFLQSVHTKIGKLLFLNQILMVFIAIFYSIPPHPASAVSSCRCSLGRLSRNGAEIHLCGIFKTLMYNYHKDPLLCTANIKEVKVMCCILCIFRTFAQSNTILTGEMFWRNEQKDFHDFSVRHTPRCTCLLSH